MICQNCGRKLFAGDKVIYKWVGWEDGDYDYFCSTECAEEYCKGLPRTDNEEVTL